MEKGEKFQKPRSKANLLRGREKIGKLGCINKNCWLVKSLNYAPYKRCQYCELKFRDCLFLHYQIISLILISLFLSLSFLIEGEISELVVISIFTLVIVYGYFFSKSTDKIIQANFTEREAKEALGELTDKLEEKVDLQTRHLKAKNLRLQKLLKMRSEFLDIASHQLRTPISIIKGSASVLSEGDFDDSSEKEKKEVYNAILIKTEKLTQIVADMLYASELDTGKFDLIGRELQTTEIIPYLEKIVKSHQELAKEKNIHLELNKTVNNIKARVSEHYFEVIIDNLIINALTYTKQDGKVEVILKPQNDTVRIEVKDNGIGVPEQDQKELFTKFKRAKNANSMHTDGSGLGLFIVKKMIKAHPKGDCGFESEEGKGSVFWVEAERAED